jgi:hypothetical protein
MDIFPVREDADYQRILPTLFGGSGHGGVRLRGGRRDVVAGGVPTKLGAAAAHGGGDDSAHLDDDSIGISSSEGADPSAMQRVPTVSRRIRRSIIARHALLSDDDVRAHILAPSAMHVSLPLLYPQNLIAWSHVRQAVNDLGRSYYYRIQLYTSFFFLMVVTAVIFLFFVLSRSQGGGDGGGDSVAEGETVLVVATAAMGQLVFGSVLTAQIVQGARANRLSVQQQRRLNRVEALVFEYVGTATCPLPAPVRDRLLQAKKVAASVVDGMRIDDTLSPARVMGVRADVALLGTIASITLSGILAAYRTLTTVTAAAGGTPGTL